jgi:hypothetical protein
MADRTMTLDLEAQLWALGPAIDVPDGVGLPAAVRARISAMPAPEVAAERRWWDRFLPHSTPVRRAVLLAVALALVVAAAAGAAAFGLPGLRFVFGPIPSASPTVSPQPSASVGLSPSASPSPSGPLGSGLGLGLPVDAADVAAAIPFEVGVPTDGRLGAPAAVWWAADLGSGQVTTVWEPTPNLPETTTDGIGALLSQTPGRLGGGLVQKIIDQGTTVEPVSVGDSRGFWISGRPHEFFWETHGGEFASTRRTVGDTLVWFDGLMLYRLESALGRDAAIEIAESIR